MISSSRARITAVLDRSPATNTNRIPGRRTMKASAALKKEANTGDCWKDFRPGDWLTSINVRDFIVGNVTPYTGNEHFLAEPSQRTKAVCPKLQPYLADERQHGALAIDARTPSTLLAANR